MTINGYPTFTGRGKTGQSRSYVIDEDKAKIVDFAIKLGRPLLVEGEAGCGKTVLAEAIAEELGLPEPIILPVRSSSRANDLFYRFDALRRLQDSQIKGKQDDAAWAHRYVELEPLGKAIQESRRCVVLIDEVDKGDVDFANDLLHALDRFTFNIDEIPDSESDKARQEGKYGRTVAGDPSKRPIVMFTSNRESQLPKPFLRRCIYLELTFPESPEALVEIVEVNLRRRLAERKPGAVALADLSPSLIRKAVHSFLKIRAKAEQNNVTKKPATAELIDWVHALHWHPEREAEVAGLTPPYWELLFRSAVDITANRDSARASAASTEKS